MAQPYDFPERLLSSNLEYYMQKKLEKHMHGQGGLEPEAVAEYIRCCTPEQIHGVCEDYRAAATLDFEMDTADFDAGHKITCPVLVLWGDKSHVEQYFNPREAWPQYATNVVRYVVVPAGHYPQEQAPDEVTRRSTGSSASDPQETWDTVSPVCAWYEPPPAPASHHGTPTGEGPETSFLASGRGQYGQANQPSRGRIWGKYPRL